MTDKKVLVGLSGGVDSAVACYLLKKQGYDVSGCFMRNWDSIANNDILGNPSLNLSKCSQEIDFDDAEKTAEELGIPCYRIDFIKEYWDDVFTYFLNEYKEGRTPNPDVFCNRYIKFSAFKKHAETLGFKTIAMGHYAIKKEDEDGFPLLYKAKDKNKDQTYFLVETTVDELTSALFPIGEYTKPEIRLIAENLNLSVAKKRDSTGVCFIGERNFKEFLENYLPSHEGDIVDIETGKIIGRHDGTLYYTNGQHRGLNIGGIKGYESSPFFVVGKDVKKNILYVAQLDSKYMYSYSCRINRVNMLWKKPVKGRIKLNAKFRYRSVDLPIEFEYVSEDEAYAYYPGYKFVTKGQVLALYDGERCLGGGTILDTYDEVGRKITY